MYLFVSDAHLGRGTYQESQAVERELLACFRYFENQLEGVFLVGDIFEQYISYKYVVPKGFVRLQGYLASLTDKGISVTYLVGNHDPWHDGYYEQEIGVKVVFDCLQTELLGKTCLIAHGDKELMQQKSYQLIRKLLQHPFPVWLYKKLIPADIGVGLAKWVTSGRTTEGFNPKTVSQMKLVASQWIEKHNPCVVVMGHCHQETLISVQDSVYLNTGFWFKRQTFGILTKQKIALCRWALQQPEVIEEIAFPTTSNSKVNH